MDPRRPAPTTILPSQSYSPPPPSTHSQSVLAEYGGDPALAASYEGGSTGYHHVVKGEAGSGSSRQPLQESSGNAQHHPHRRHPHQQQHQQQQQQQQQHHHHQVTSHYPSGQYPLPSLPSTRSCTPALPSSSTNNLSSSLGHLAAPPPPIPTPPILPTQSLVGSSLHHAGSATSAAAAVAATAGGSISSSSSLRLRRYHDLMHRKNRNPIYDCPEFAQYRLKQKDKDRQVWPDVLEHAFLDALLLILFMGRRKFYMGGKQHGRNMIISEYIWLRYLATLPPGTEILEYPRDNMKGTEVIKIPKPHLKDEDPERYHSMYRKRKQVSSHIQVLKGFFRLNWAYNFLFSKGKEEGSKDKNKLPAPNRWYKENTDQRSFKGDPVLTALEQKRLPSVRPNYEYFRQLLAMDSKVQVRPSTCYTYVANKCLRDQPASAPSSSNSLVGSSKTGCKADFSSSSSSSSDGPSTTAATLNPYRTTSSANPNGSSHTVVETYHTKRDKLLYPEHFPHRYAFNNPVAGDESPWTAREREVRNIRATLLHEYAFELKQTESSSAREVLDEWEAEHADLHHMLTSVMAQHDLQNAHALPASQVCDIIHVDVTFDVHRVHCLPEDTNLEWLFKMQVAQPGLQGHDWRVRTWLERPVELARSKSEVGRGQTVVMSKDEQHLMNEMTHVRGCGDDNPHCECRNRHRSNTWLVPIPATIWAESLDMCAQFPPYLKPKKQGSSRGRKEDEMPESDTVTQMDLMRGTAMFQELWSSAPVVPGSLEPAAWTRRAVILWTFNTIHFFDKDNNLCETPAGTSWRFLSAVDPLSSVHQERVLLQGSASNDRDVMSPSPAYQQILNSQMADNLSSVWSLPSGGVHSAPASMPVSPLAPYVPSPLHVHGHGNYTNGLVTPPPSAALPSTYAFEGASSIVHSQSLGGQHMGYLPVSSIDTKSTTFVSDGFDTDSYLQGTGHNTFYEEADDNESDTTLQGESAADLSNFGAQQWPNMNSNAHATNQAVSLDWDNHGLDNHGLHSLSLVAEELAGNSGDTKTSSFDEEVQHLQQSYDPYASLRAAAREARTQSPNGYLRHEQHRLRDSYGRRVRREGSGDAHSDAWHTAAAAASTPTDPAAGSTQDYSHDTAAHHLSQSTVGWTDEMSQLHHSQPSHRVDGLPMAETRALQDYGPASLSPLLNRKRRRDDDEDDESNTYSLGPMPTYPHRDDGRYAPTAIMDRQKGHTWS